MFNTNFDKKSSAQGMIGNFLKKSYQNNRAQGTIEYLIIIAIVVVIALVVVGLLTGFFATGSGVSTTQQQIGQQTQMIAIVDSLVSSDGDYLLELKSNDFDSLKIEAVNVDGVEINFCSNNVISLGDGKIFVVPTGEFCTEGGKKLVKNLTITYVQNGIKKNYYFQNVSINCTEYNLSDTKNLANSLAADGTTCVSINLSECTINDWTPSYGECQENNTRSVTWTKTTTCEGGYTPITTSESCQYGVETFTVIFDSQGGSSVSSISGVESGETITLPTPTREGYTFVEWNTSANGSGSTFTSSTQVNSNITIYAQWEGIYFSNGNIDLTFNSGIGANDSIYAIKSLPGGKILIAGRFTSYDGTLINRVARLNSDGTLDNTFNPGTGALQDIYTIALLSDGKYLLGGAFTLFNGFTKNRIVRLNQDGSIDHSFNEGGSGTEINGHITEIQILPDDKILIAGNFTSYNGTSINRIARLNSNGTIDTTFNPGSGADNKIETIQILPDDKILIGGWFFSYDGVNKKCIARLNSNGTLDSSFNSNIINPQYISQIKMKDNYLIISGSEFYSYAGFETKNVAKIGLDELFINTFNWNIDEIAGEILIQPDDKILVASWEGPKRFNLDGTTDNTFVFGEVNSLINALEIQEDNKILVGGSFTEYNGQTVGRIVRLGINN